MVLRWFPMHERWSNKQYRKENRTWRQTNVIFTSGGCCGSKAGLIDTDLPTCYCRTWQSLQKLAIDWAPMADISDSSVTANLAFIHKTRPVINLFQSQWNGTAQLIWVKELRMPSTKPNKMAAGDLVAVDICLTNLIFSDLTFKAYNEQFNNSKFDQFEMHEICKNPNLTFLIIFRK